MDVLRNFFAATFLLAVFSFLNTTNAAIVDQVHLPYATPACAEDDPEVCLDHYVPLWIPIYSHGGYSQSFTVEVDGVLSGLDVFVSNIMTSYPSGAFNVAIWKMSGGLLNSVPDTNNGDEFLFSKDVSQNDWNSEALAFGPYSASMAHLDFTDYGINALAGDHYSFVLSRNTISSSIPTPMIPMSRNRLFISMVGYRNFDFYKGGIAGSLGDSIPDGDFTFRTYVTSSVPIPASIWLFTSGLLGLIGLVVRKNYV